MTILYLVATASLLTQVKSESIEVPEKHPKIDMVLLPGGTVRAGEPARGVILAPFRMGVREVTWADLNAFFRKAPHFKHGDDFMYLTEVARRENFQDAHPAVGLTWHTALAYCDWLSKVTGHYFRLPTENEWDYALRGGGEIPASLDEVAWQKGNAAGMTHPVGTKKANGFGLYDMLGNAAEYALEPHSPPFFSPILRGGSWGTPAGPNLVAGREPLQEEWVDCDAFRPRSSIWLVGPKPCQGMRLVSVAGPEDREARDQYRNQVQIQVTEVENQVELKVGRASYRFSRVKGVLQNGGKRDLIDLEIQIYPLDSKSQPHLTDTEPPVGRLTWGKVWPVLTNSFHDGVHRKPLAPGEKRSFEGMLPESYDDENDVPPGKFGARVTNLRFAQ